MVACHQVAIAVGVVGPEKNHFLEVYGMPELTDAFLIGSLSKSVTALAVMLLVEDSVLALDAPASKWIPGIPDAVTIEHLLHQVSGLERDDGADAWTDLDATIEEQVASASFELPAQEYAYANLNYELLGAIVERASGKSYGAFVQERIFEPMKMSNSTATSTRPAERAAGYQFVYGFPQPFGEPPYRASSVSAGFVWMSPEDMARWIRLFVTGGKIDGVQVFPPAVMKALLEGPSTNYAKGWVFTTAHAPLEVALHDGLTAAFSSAMAVVPEREFGIFVLTNVNSWLAMAPMNVLRGLLGSILGGPTVSVTNLEFIGRLVFGLIVALVFLTFLFELVRWIRSGFSVRLYRKQLISALLITGINIAVVAAVVFSFGTNLVSLVKTQPDLGYGFILLIVLGTIRGFLTAFNKSAIRAALDAETES